MGPALCSGAWLRVDSLSERPRLVAQEAPRHRL